MNIHTLIQTVREQLEIADEQRRLAAKPPLFKLEKLEFEIRVVATETKSIGGGLDLRILTANKDSQREVESAHVITITYTTAMETGDPPPGSRAHSLAKSAEKIDVPLIQ